MVGREEAAVEAPALGRARALDLEAARRVLAGEVAARHRRPGDEPQPLGGAGRSDLLVEVAHHQAVLRLVAGEADPAVALAEPHRLDQAPRLVVRAAGVEHLALAHEIVEGAQHLVERGLMVDVMDVVDVDVVGLQPFQAGLDLLLDVQPRHAGVVGPVAHRVEHLGGDDRVVPPSLQRLAQHRLRRAADIGVGGVEERPAGLEHGAHHARRFGLIGAVAEGHRAEADLGDFEAGTAEASIVHSLTPVVGDYARSLMQPMLSSRAQRGIYGWLEP